jgi:hypothetical protein
MLGCRDRIQFGSRRNSTTKTMMSIKEFEYLWTTAGGRYVLISLGPEQPDTLMPYDREKHNVILVDDDVLYAQVVRQMRAAGVPIVAFEDRGI